MEQLKAVVLEKKGSTVIVLAGDGSFQKIRYRHPVEIGAEIEIPQIQSRQPFWRVAVSIAAVFLLVIIGVTSWNFYQGMTAVAMISVDINPRLELTLDRKGRVLEFDSLNPDAERVLAGLPLKGEPWSLALAKIIGQAVSLHYLNPDRLWVLVGYSPVQSGINNPDGVTPEGIMEKIESAAQAQGIQPKVAVYQLTAEEQAKAQQNGLTLGEYALLNTAQQVGIEADANTVKNTAERVKLLEQPQIQAQMQKDNRVKANGNLAVPTIGSRAANPGQQGILDNPEQNGPKTTMNNGNNRNNLGNTGNSGNRNNGKDRNNASGNSASPQPGNGVNGSSGRSQENPVQNGKPDKSDEDDKYQGKDSDVKMDEEPGGTNSSEQNKGKSRPTFNQRDSGVFHKGSE